MFMLLIVRRFHSMLLLNQIRPVLANSHFKSSKRGDLHTPFEVKTQKGLGPFLRLKLRIAMISPSHIVDMEPVILKRRICSRQRQALEFLDPWTLTTWILGRWIGRRTIPPRGILGPVADGVLLGDVQHVLPLNRCIVLSMGFCLRVR